MSEITGQVWLAGAAHMDRCGRAYAPVELGRSNPGTFEQMPGGTALNMASCLTALGVSARLFTILGTDEAARTVRNCAQERAIALHAQSTDQHPTASYTSLHEPEGGLVAGLADMDIYQAFDAAAVVPQMESCGSSDWLVVDANLPPAALAMLLDNATLPKAAFTVSAAKAERLRGHLQQVDLLFTNRAEAAALCDVEAGGPLEEIAAALWMAGSHRAIISDGDGPLCILEDGRSETVDVGHCPVKDVTGAGDALAAGCLVGLMGTKTLRESAQIGIAAAHAILGVTGPWRADLGDAVAEATNS